MDFVRTSTVIQVQLEVTRYRAFEEDGLVEVWGYVGDYEVCVHLPLEEACDKGLRIATAAAQRRPKRQ